MGRVAPTFWLIVVSGSIFGPSCMFSLLNWPLFLDYGLSRFPWKLCW